MSGAPETSPPLYRAWSKGIRSDVSEPGYSAKWVFSRRGWLKAFNNRLEFGNAVIHTADVRKAILYEARQWSIVPVYILSVATDSGNWQFGLNPWTDIGPHLPFSFQRERIRLGHSWFSLVLRVAIAAWLAQKAYQRFAG